MKENFLQVFEDDQGVKVFTKMLRDWPLERDAPHLQSGAGPQETAGMMQHFVNLCNTRITPDSDVTGLCYSTSCRM